MHNRLGAGAAAALMATALVFATPAFANTRATGVSSTSTSIGNNTTIVVSGGTASVTQTSNCSGVSGFLYQSIRLLFGGTVTTYTQSKTCP